MPKLSLTIACENYDRVQPIRRGEVDIQGCEVNFLELGPEELFFRALRHGEFDVAELSLSSYLLGVSRGKNPYIAVPVFLSRLFRHSAIYIRNDRGITRPEDLKGKRVGVPEYQLTACLWVRVLLDSEYGVAPGDISWMRGGLHESGRVEKINLNLPADVIIENIPADANLNAMLAAGEIDALVSPRPPRCFSEGHDKVQRLFPDYRTAEEAYYKKTGIFPIMHVLGIRRDLVEAHPWLANSVYSAFVDAKAATLKAMHDTAALKVTLPWLMAHIEDTEKLFGADFWPYGIDPNIAALEAMVKYAHKHGTADRALSINELFVPSTLERFKV
ncbi:ABC transporter substrate-binding protein [Actibacterium sp. D379-3]